MSKILGIVDEVRARTRLPYRLVCETIRIPYSSFMRIRRRSRLGRALIRHPGPGKAVMPDMASLSGEIAHLCHGAKRTAGVGDLYAAYAPYVSRRELGCMVVRARREVHSKQRRSLQRIRWNVPGVVWAVDPTEYLQDDPFGKRVFITNIRDLGSRYTLPPLVGGYSTDKTVAEHVNRLMVTFGAPVFLKRDNGENLNGTDLAAVLDVHAVVPVNSPAYYPRYNGGIETANGELKTCIRQKLLPFATCPREHFKAYAEAAAHDLNHRQRPVLNGKTACQVFFGEKRTFNRTERRDVFLWLSGLERTIFLSMKLDVTESVYYAVRRVTARTWLEKEGIITIKQNPKVLPIFQRFWSH